MSRDRKTYRASTVSRVAGVSANSLNTWLKRGVLKLNDPNQTGWTRYTYEDLLTVCAWAEVRRMGIAPNQAPRLVEFVANDLHTIAFDGLPRSSERLGRFVVAEIWDPIEGEDDEKIVMNPHLSTDWEGVVKIIWKPQFQPVVDSASFVIVDMLKLWRRIAKALADLESNAE